MGSLFQALGSLAQSYGTAGLNARADQQQKEQLAKQQAQQDAYLKLAKVREDREAAAYKLNKDKFEHELVDIPGATPYAKNGMMVIPQRRVVDGSIVETPLRPIAQGGGTLPGLASVLEQSSVLTPEDKKMVVAQAQEEYRQTGDEKAATSSAFKVIDQLVEKRISENAATQREKDREKKEDERARLSREAASNRQQAGFREREKMSTNLQKYRAEADDADSRVTIMADDVVNAERNPNGSGAFDMDLLSQHIALTFGSMKGGARGQKLIDEHIKARSLPENLVLMYQSLKSGARLSPQQRRNFLSLAKARQKAAWSKYNDVKSTISQPDSEQQETPSNFDLQPEGPQ